MNRDEAAGAPDSGPSPAGYVEVASPGGTWVSRPGCVAAIVRGELDYLLRGPGPRRPAAGGGRGPLLFLHLGGEEAVAKRPVHGGLLGRLIGGLYWGRERVLAQVHAAQWLRGQGVSTPEILAAGWRSVAGPLQHQALIAKTIPGAINLYEASRNPPPGLRRRTILRESAVLVRRMHDAGFLHADLNLTNLVLEPGARGPLVHIVDLDRGRLQSRVGLSERALNLARLLRSYEKWLAAEAPLSGREELYFLRCYARSEGAMVRRLWRFLQNYRRSLGPRRLAWRLRLSRASNPRAVDRLQ